MSTMIPIPLTSHGQPATPTRTYCLNFDNNVIENYCDGVDAIRQAILKALLTRRFTFLIYGSDYGSEIQSLVGKNVSTQFIESDIERLLTEALTSDSRVLSVEDIDFSFSGDEVNISFSVKTVLGYLEFKDVEL